MTILDKEDNKKVKKSKKKKKQNYLLYKIVSFVLIIMTVWAVGTFIYRQIIDVTHMIPIVLVITIITVPTVFILNKKKLRAWIKNIFTFLAFVIIICDLLFLIYGTSLLKLLSSFTDTGYRVQTYGVYVLEDSNYKKLKQLRNKNLNYLKSNDETLKTALKNLEKMIPFNKDSNNSIDELVDTLLDNKVEAVIFPTSYEDILKEEYEEKYNKIRLLETIDIVEYVETLESDKDVSEDPFVIYISGIDTSGNVQSKARSDVNILVAVNPVTGKILLVNTPRDYYVTLHTQQSKDKLTHAGIYGVEESLHTLGDLYEVDVDYYVRINFTSFVKIVDALDGIKVEVPKKFCEQNSKRSKKNGDLICLNKGLQTLNGEQALALARHRKTLPGGDRTRGENQMKVLEAILNKVMSPKILSSYERLISALEGKVSTNMTTNEMYLLVNRMRELETLKIDSIAADGSDSKGKCYSTGSSIAYVMEQKEETITEIKTKLKEVLEY